MPKPCKAGEHTARTGRGYKGLDPPGCKIQVGAGNQAVKPRTAAATGKDADKVTVAKQRLADNSAGARPDENRIARDIRVHYHRPSEAAGLGHVVEIQGAILDTGAMIDLFLNFRRLRSLFPGGSTDDRWQRLIAEKPYGAKVSAVSGISGVQQKTVVIPKNPYLTVEIKLKVGQKGHQIDEWRGGPAKLHITPPAPVGSVRGMTLVGMGFLRDHHIMLK